MSRRKNFICRACGKQLPCAYTRKFPATNVRVRYFKCSDPKCGRTWKAKEQITPTNSGR